MTTIGEHTGAGALGHTLAVVSFAFAAMAAASFFFSARRDDAAWLKLGRLGFRVHSLAVAGIVATLFVMLLNHWFEYDYVWKHSNRAMPLRYIFSCFWEGQEGSFLLWTFWHVVIGNILMLRAKSWEAPVMAVVALVQVFLATMLLGIHFADVRVGSSPFLLIRQLPENIGLPWTTMENYLQVIPQFADGRGLNPLLQNYWMVIHPPTLFLGFACTLVPFAYAIAGLWRSRVKEWIAPALPWTFLGVMVLGMGILMGGAWAYEALSFGGFWAWDPVENASLVPWITLVGAGHLMMINRRREATSLFTTFLLVLLTFLLVLYSTFLTRSGVLGDTSVHSFTGEGMLPGLLIFMLSFIALSVAMLNAQRHQRGFYALLCLLILILALTLKVYVAAILVFGAVSIAMLVVAYRTGPWRARDEEKFWSREFWLFIGALVLLLSAMQITFSTSVPVVNLLLEPFTAQMGMLAERTDSEFFRSLAGAKLAPPSEAIAHYNKWQIPFAFIVSLLVAIGQYLRWKDTDMKRFRRQLLVSFGIALLLTAVGVIALGYRFREANLVALFFATTFAAAANAAYIVQVLKGRLDHAGPSVAHTGFALVLLGALISTSRRNEISRNTQGPDLRFFSEEFSNSTDLLLYKGDTVRMGERFVTYVGKREDGVNLRFDMDHLAAVPARYRAGDTVRVRSSLFIASDDHVASSDFLADQPAHWKELADFPRRALWNARHWGATKPGDKLFTLEPTVQLNPRFGNVAEPSTRHWIDRDLYTHIRYADLDTKDTTDHMPPRLYDKTLGDTIVTPTSVIVMDSLRTVRDSVTITRLGPDYTVYLLRMRVRDLYIPDRWFEAKPVIIYKGRTPVGGKGFEVRDLKQKYELATVDGNKIGLNVFDREFVVLQAIVFPGINILWTGCVLMALGTFMAVRRRFRSERTKG